MVLCGEAEHGAGVESAAEIATDRDVSAEAQANGFFEYVAKLRAVIGVGTLWAVVFAGVVEVPVLMDVDVLVGGENVMSGWNLEYSVEQCT
jgi:hypothetical protein